MTPDFARAARELLAREDGAGAAAERAARSFEQLALHLSRIVGSNGVLTVLKRSVALSAPELPWLAEVRTQSLHEAAGDLFEMLETAFAKHPPEAIGDAFALLLSRFITLLGKLIGDALVWRLLQEVWPTIFPEAKETP